MAKGLKKSEREDKQGKALDLYVNTDYTQEEISSMVGVSARTINQWSTKGNWRELKAASKITVNKILSNLYNKIYEGTKKDSDKPLSSDEIAKIASSIEKMKDSRVSVSALTNSFKEFTTYLMGVNPALAKEIVVHQHQFLQQFINRGHN